MKENSGAEQLVKVVVEGIQEKKGKNITVLDLRHIEHSVCQYFIICEGESTTQADAIGNSVIDVVKEKQDEKPYKTEGFTNAEWILVDYVDVVVHVFQQSVREFYNLEALWADAKREDIQNLF